jgi:very-short-patch-repair endonuclease
VDPGNVAEILSEGDRCALEADWAYADDCFQKCGSPIEELFLAQCVCSGNFQWSRTDDSLVGSWEDLEPLSLFQQFIEGRYRIDFAITTASGPRVAIELDGHDWHERNKQQAERDKSRDRRLQELGWKVLRFTGSEVWRDATDCVNEVLRIAGGA